MRTSAADALGTIGGSNAVKALRSCEKDPDKELVAHVKAALTKIEAEGQ